MFTYIKTQEEIELENHLKTKINTHCKFCNELVIAWYDWCQTDETFEGCQTCYDEFAHIHRDISSLESKLEKLKDKIERKFNTSSNNSLPF